VNYPLLSPPDTQSFTFSSCYKAHPVARTCRHRCPVRLAINLLVIKHNAFSNRHIQERILPAARTHWYGYIRFYIHFLFPSVTKYVLPIFCTVEPSDPNVMLPIFWKVVALPLLSVMKVMLPICFTVLLCVAL
jgi:hypothetical protein